MPIERVREDRPRHHRSFSKTLLKELRICAASGQCTLPCQAREFREDRIAVCIDYDLMIEIACGLHCHGSPLVLSKDDNGDHYFSIDHPPEVYGFICQIEDGLDIIEPCDRSQIDFHSE